MSVSIGLGINKQKNQIHPYQQLFRNILERLDSIQGHQVKPYLKTTFVDPSAQKEMQKIEQKMKIIINSNVQNLRMVEENMKQNIEQLYQKVRNFENKIIRTLKEKQQVLQYLQFRVVSVETSQKNVTQFMKKVSEHESEKYSGVPVLEQRIIQMEHLFQLKNRKTSDHIKILHEEINMEISKSIKFLDQKINRNKQQLNENRLNKQKSQIGNPKQQIRQLKRKIQLVQVQLKEQTINCAKLQSIVKEYSQNTQEALRKIQKRHNQIISNESSLKSSKQIAVKPKFNTQGHEQDLNCEPKNNSIFSKKTETPQRSSLLPPKPIQNQNKNTPHQLLGRTSREQSDRDSQTKNKLYQVDESDQDPFQNMVGGIRGLLKKSKEKQAKFDSKKKMNENIGKKKPLPRQQKLGELTHESGKNYLMDKNLPPVKGDLKKHSRPSYINSEQNQEQEQVYQVDQDGFLLDEEGNYLYDQDGNRVQIEEQMYDLIEDRR